MEGLQGVFPWGKHLKIYPLVRRLAGCIPYVSPESNDLKVTKKVGSEDIKVSISPLAGRLAGCFPCRILERWVVTE